MAEYKHFYVQQQTFNGTSYVDVGDVIDTYTAFKVVCQEMPFKYLPETKDLPQRDWMDEDGVDVFVPSDGMKFKAYDIEAKFLYVGDEDDIAKDIKAFVDFITGRTNITGETVSQNSKNVMLAIYDEYTSVGKRGMYVTRVGDDLFYYTDKTIEAIARFSVSFKVTDPVYNVQYNNNVLI